MPSLAHILYGEIHKRSKTTEKQVVIVVVGVRAFFTGTNASSLICKTLSQAFFFKDRLGLDHNERLVSVMGTWTEGLVDVSLIAIGLLRPKESLLDFEEAPAFEAKSTGSAAVEGGGAGTLRVAKGSCKSDLSERGFARILLGRDAELGAGSRAVFVGERALVSAGVLLGDNGELVRQIICSRFPTCTVVSL